MTLIITVVFKFIYFLQSKFIAKCFQFQMENQKFVQMLIVNPWILRAVIK